MPRHPLSAVFLWWLPPTPSYTTKRRRRSLPTGLLTKPGTPGAIRLSGLGRSNADKPWFRFIVLPY